MAGHGVTLPQYVAIARHTCSPCPRIPLILVSIPIWLPRNDPWSVLKSTTYIVRCSPQTSSWASPGYLGSGAVGWSRDLARPASARSDLGICLLRTYIRQQEPSFSSPCPL
jgi:hypothetical protein